MCRLSTRLKGQPGVQLDDARAAGTGELSKVRAADVAVDGAEVRMVRAVQQPFAFERFLKNYHLLELLFDWQTMKEISDFYIDNNFRKAADVLLKYKREDIDRIKYIISEAYKNKSVDIIVEKLNKKIGTDLQIPKTLDN